MIHSYFWPVLINMEKIMFPIRRNSVQGNPSNRKLWANRLIGNNKCFIPSNSKQPFSGKCLFFYPATAVRFINFALIGNNFFFGFRLIGNNENKILFPIRRNTLYQNKLNFKFKGGILKVDLTYGMLTLGNMFIYLIILLEIRLKKK